MKLRWCFCCCQTSEMLVWLMPLHITYVRVCWSFPKTDHEYSTFGFERVFWRLADWLLPINSYANCGVVQYVKVSTISGSSQSGSVFILQEKLIKPLVVQQSPALPEALAWTAMMSRLRCMWKSLLLSCWVMSRLRRWQLTPVQPAGQLQRPLTWSHLAPFWHSQVWLQRSPKRPCGHSTSANHTCTNRHTGTQQVYYWLQMQLRPRICRKRTTFWKDITVFSTHIVNFSLMIRVQDDIWSLRERKMR